MKLLKQNIRLIAMIVCALFIALIGYGAFSISTQGQRWFSSSANTYLRRAKSYVQPGNIVDRNNILLAATNAQGRRVYSSDPDIRKAVLHAVGDDVNNIAYGAESFMANYLYAFNESYPNLLVQALKGEKRRGNDIKLLIDSALSKKAYSLFPKGKSGALIVMNYRTGEVLALQSYPSYDPMNLSQADKDNPLKPFWNRATMWSSAPGSVFKVVTLASALKNIPDAQSKMYECLGALVVEDTTVTDANDAVHGMLNLRRALAVSCNITFARVAMELGDAKLQKTSSDFGVGDYFLFSDLVVQNSAYPSVDRSMKELAWTGPGQSKLQLTPMHMALIASAIANDGVMMEPRLLLDVTDNAGISRYQFYGKEYKRVMQKQDADIIADYMQEAARSGTATASAVSGLKIAGKTGSAQIDAQGQTNAWYIGFIDDARYPYAVCVAIEDAGSGGSVAAPIAGQLFRYLSGK